MITFTDTARRHVASYLEQETDPLAVRVEVLDSSPLAPKYDLSLIAEDERAENDQVFDAGGFEVVIPGGSAELLEGATVDWVDSMGGSGFKVENPNLRPIGVGAPTGDLAEQVRQVIDLQINPSIASHGGEINLVDVRNTVVYLEMSGGCQGCGMAAATLSQGVRRILMEALPQITEIQDVTNHAAGANPYY
ncbi:MAG: iron-sulfur cluster assembly accessory protein [Gemmatimonadales bacterium]|nr:MAG: iron-sulfur cluster assembly accessory protein [Gemmatimonadales bacterium]